MDTRGTKQQAEAILPTEWGDFIISAHAEDAGTYSPHMVMRHPDLDLSGPVYVRVHSECVTGDIFHSKKCDCGEQLQQSMQMIAAERGVLIYLRQEGRGIGIINKIKAYRHQEAGLDTIAANEALGLKSDYRGYREAADILKSMGVTHIKLITNNPEKIKDLEENGIEVIERIPIIIPANSTSQDYLATKEKEMGHLLQDSKN